MRVLKYTFNKSDLISTLSSLDDVILLRKSRDFNHNRIKTDLSHDQERVGTRVRIRLVHSHVHFKAKLYQAISVLIVVVTNTIVVHVNAQHEDKPVGNVIGQTTMKECVV